MNIFIRATFATLCTCFFTISAFADGGARADGHAPIGVMGDHLHKKDEWMLSYRFMYMDMEGNRQGGDNISLSEIATTVANPFFGLPSQPPTLRVVPLSMSMQMHMFGVMYAPSDWITLMGMMNYTEKEMDHVTFAGGMGGNVRGKFTTRSSGFGDSSLVALLRLMSIGVHKAHAQVGLSFPTGSTDETDRILTPSGATPVPRLPYAMQLGSGTTDLLPGVSYVGRIHPYGWGAQYRGTIRLEKDNGYQWGDRHRVTGWLSYGPRPWISASLRAEFDTMGKIDGRDPRIVAPVQTADPNNYGGDRVDMKFGINLLGQTGWLHGHRVAIEASVPVLQDLNGPQMETDYAITVGWQYAIK